MNKNNLVNGKRKTLRKLCCSWWTHTHYHIVSDHRNDINQSWKTKSKIESFNSFIRIPDSGLWSGHCYSVALLIKSVAIASANAYSSWSDTGWKEHIVTKVLFAFHHHNLMSSDFDAFHHIQSHAFEYSRHKLRFATISLSFKFPDFIKRFIVGFENRVCTLNSIFVDSRLKNPFQFTWNMIRHKLFIKPYVFINR